MITQPIVLVLGAGASVPYGFPTGVELKNELLNSLGPTTIVSGKNRTRLPNDNVKQIIEIESSAEEIWEFREQLRLSQQPSVDAFLEHRAEYLKVGKLAIAQCLIPRENETSLFDYSEGIYQYLFQKMNAPFDEYHNNQLSVITFNYDRSFEHALFTALKYRYNKSDEECAKVIKQIPIIHVHGRLGYLPWESKENSRQYTPDITTNDLKLASEQIIIVSEGIETSPEFELAYKLMKRASKIYFLGFGYYDVNLKRLKLNALPEKYIRDRASKSYFMGTAMGLENAEVQTIIRKWKMHLPDNTSDSLTFLKKYVEFE